MVGFCCFSGKSSASSAKPTFGLDEDVLSIQNLSLYSYRELRTATDNFSSFNKIGQGGFGYVYKGVLRDGSMAAIKVLSAQSRQGVNEFLTEIKVITSIEHDNLVKLYGCCVEDNQRILVYGYLENNSLAQTLLSGESNSIQFNWETRRKICIGVAKGLAFLHEEVKPHIIHRDIKASNILLDKDLVPKISDFGLAKLMPPEWTHISTRVAGTTGYLAPEYAIRGQVTRKADIYSFGILLLEIVCGRSNTVRRFLSDDKSLLEEVWELHERGMLVKLVDSSVKGDLDLDEACRFLKIGLLCTQDLPKLRPVMSTVAQMLLGEIDVDGMTISEPGMVPRPTAHGVGALKKEVVETEGSSSTAGSGGKLNDSSSSSGNTATTSFATMTFSSIFDRR